MLPGKGCGFRESQKMGTNNAIHGRLKHVVVMGIKLE